MAIASRSVPLDLLDVTAPRWIASELRTSAIEPFGDGRCEANRPHRPHRAHEWMRRETAWSSPTMSARITLRLRLALVRTGILSSNQGGISLAKSVSIQGCQE